MAARLKEKSTNVYISFLLVVKRLNLNLGTDCMHDIFEYTSFGWLQKGDGRR